MYAVEVVDVTIPLWLKRVSSSMKVVEKKREKRVVNVNGVVKEEKHACEEGSENRETSNVREGNVVPPNEVGLEKWVINDVVHDFISSASYDKANPLHNSWINLSFNCRIYDCTFSICHKT
jgi:hypothetical protein